MPQFLPGHFHRGLVRRTSAAEDHLSSHFVLTWTSEFEQLVAQTMTDLNKGTKTGPVIPQTTNLSREKRAKSRWF